VPARGELGEKGGVTTSGPAEGEKKKKKKRSGLLSAKNSRKPFERKKNQGENQRSRKPNGGGKVWGVGVFA